MLSPSSQGSLGCSPYADLSAHGLRHYPLFLLQLPHRIFEEFWLFVLLWPFVIWLWICCSAGEVVHHLTETQRKSHTSSFIRMLVMLLFYVLVMYSFSSFIFNWRIIVLQCCFGFCHTTTWISHKYTYIPSLLNLPPTPPLWVVTEHQAALPVLYQNFPLASYFT